MGCEESREVVSELTLILWGNAETSDKVLSVAVKPVPDF